MRKSLLGITRHPFSYEVGNVRYPRLTRILSILRDPEVEHWVSTIGTTAAMRRQAAARKRGVLIHQMIAKTLGSGKDVSCPAKASFDTRMCWQAWKRWYGLRQGTLGKSPLPIVEAMYVNPAYGYGCTPDLVEVESRTITDWKTGSRLSPKHWIQVHAEVPLVFGDKPEGVRVRLVRLDPAIGDMEEIIQPFDQKVWETFLKLKDVYMAWYGKEMNMEESHGDKPETDLTHGANQSQ